MIHTRHFWAKVKSEQFSVSRRPEILWIHCFGTRTEKQSAAADGQAVWFDHVLGERWTRGVPIAVNKHKTFEVDS